MEAKKPGDLEGQPLDKTLARTPEKEKPPSLSLHPKSVTRDGGADEIPNKTVAGGERKSEKPQGSEAGPLLSPTAAAAAKAAAAGGVTDLQKKLQRAERFGMPVQLSEEEKRNSRAERFGMGSPLHEKSEEMKRKARAERFGTGGPSLDDEAKKKARITRFGADTKLSSLEEEKRKARAARFSQPIPTSAPSQETAMLGEPSILADKLEGGT